MTRDQNLSFGWNEKGEPLVRIRLLAAVASLLNVQFKVGGIPYGADYRRAINQTERRNAGPNVDAGQSAAR